MNSTNFKPVRIGNIEYHYESDDMFKFEHVIIQWFKNSYYGKFDEYVNNGYIERNGFLIKDNIYLDKNLFNRPEMNIMIGYLKFNDSKDEYDIVSLGRRLFNLSDSDMKDLKRVLNILDEEIDDRENF